MTMDYANYFTGESSEPYTWDAGSAATAQAIAQFIEVPSRILEVGAGLHPLFADSTRVDLSAGAHYVGSIESTPFPDRSFDYIVMSHVLEHVKSDMLAVRECERLLEPGGRLIVFSPANASGVCTPKEIERNGHIRRYNRSRVALLESPGFPCVYFQNVHRAHNLVWNRMKYVLKALNFPFSFIDGRDLYERKIYRALQPRAIAALDALDRHMIGHGNALFVFERIK